MDHGREPDVLADKKQTNIIVIFTDLNPPTWWQVEFGFVGTLDRGQLSESQETESAPHTLCTSAM